MFSALAGAAGHNLVSGEGKMRLEFRTPHGLCLGPCLGFNFWTSLAFSKQTLTF